MQKRKKLKARILGNSSPAPKEWSEISIIKKQRPDPIGICGSSLQRFDGTSICQWFAKNSSAVWYPVSDLFIVE